MQGLIGKKVGMTRIFDPESGREVPITVIAVGSNVVQQVKTPERDGYSAVQLGFGVVSENRVNKARAGHAKKHNSQPAKVLKEFDLEPSDEGVASGQSVGVEALEGVRFVNVTGRSKGRGFAGTIKRYNFHRGPKTHGSKSYRERGSHGPCTYPARIFPGLKMAGQYGNVQKTVKNLELVGIEKEAGLLYVKGAVPGANKGVVFVKKSLTVG